jgi:hypothetical protein
MKSLFQKFVKPGKEEFITVVSGLPRSGTSMMMKMLEAGGIPPMTDQVRTADSDNPKGYYEFERVKQLDKGDTAWLPEARGKVVKVISALLKYLTAGEQYRVVFIRRNMDEILASQRKMLVNRGEDPDKQDDTQMAILFQKHLGQVQNWLASQPNMKVLYLHYSDIMDNPQPEIEKINVFLGGSLDVERMAAAVDPDLYRNRSG